MTVAFWSEDFKFKNTDIVIVESYGIKDIGVVIGRTREEDETEQLKNFYLVDLGTEGNHWFEDFELKLL